MSARLSLKYASCVMIGGSNNVLYAIWSPNTWRTISTQASAIRMPPPNLSSTVPPTAPKTGLV